MSRPGLPEQGSTDEVAERQRLIFSLSWKFKIKTSASCFLLGAAREESVAGLSPGLRGAIVSLCLFTWLSFCMHLCPNLLIRRPVVLG